MWQNPFHNFGDTHTVCFPTAASARESAEQAAVRSKLSGKGHRKLDESSVVTLDQALDVGVFTQKVRVMKMDVEGYEPNVFAGGERFFESRFAPEIVVMETHLGNLNNAFGKERGADKLREMFAFLVRKG